MARGPSDLVPTHGASAVPYPKIGRSVRLWGSVNRVEIFNAIYGESRSILRKAFNYQILVFYADSNSANNLCQW